MQFMKESVFVSSIRSFCSAFMSVIGIGLGIILVVIALATMIGQDHFPDRSELTFLPDANGVRKVLPLNTPAILCLKVDGFIGGPHTNANKFRNLLLDSREGLLANDRVKAILLMMNTPGGTVTDADDIYRALKDYSEKFNVPVYAYVDGLCASGGMYIASSAKKVYATPASVIGSVGVLFGPTFNFSQAMEKVGVQSLTITQGMDKDSLNPFRPWKPDEDKSLRDITSYLYSRFVNIVASARPNLNKDLLINTYGAHIFASPTAKDHGYVDVADANYSSTLNDIIKDIGLAEGKGYQVVTLSPAEAFLSNFAPSSILNYVAKCFGITLPDNEISKAMQGKFLYLYEPGLGVK